jgi:hypothetical protein
MSKGRQQGAGGPGRTIATWRLRPPIASSGGIGHHQQHGGERGDESVATALLKTAFVMIVLFLMIVILVPAQLALDLILPLERGGNRLLPGIIVLIFCMSVANRITSLLFWKTHLSGERWSIFDHRRSHGSG